MRTKPAPRSAREAGFSVVEALLAAAILLIIAIGMIPLFSRAILNNALGNDYTQATAHGTSDLEEAWKQPLDSDDLTLKAGTSRQRVKYAVKGLQSGSPVSDLDWVYTPADPASVLWTRTTQTRLYHIDALDDGEVTADELVPAGSSREDWQLMEVTTFMDSGKVTPSARRPFAGIRQTNFQYLKDK